MIATGALVTALSGGCSIVFGIDAVGSAWLLSLPFGGLPFLTGLALVYFGWRVRKRYESRNSGSPRTENEV